jgi:FkbM family methyltransferase
MRAQVAESLVRVYDRVSSGGVLDRPVPRRMYESVYLAYKRLIEAGPIDSLSTVVAEGSTVIDVGANIGFFSLRFADWVGPTGHVIAIEPEKQNMRSLHRRVERAGLTDVVSCVEAAATARAGEVKLALNRGHPGDHHLAQEGEPVAAVTLDEVVVGDARPVTLVKIDVQGAEPLVLAGASDLITRHHPAIFIEIHEPSLARIGSSRRRLIHELVDLGYGAHGLTRRGIGEPEDPEALIARSEQGYIDVLFLPIGSAPG